MRDHYIFQTIHTLSHHALHVAEHCRILERSYLELFFQPLFLDTESIQNDIESLLVQSGSPSEVSVFVELRIYCDGTTSLTICDSSLYDGYALRCLAPAGVPLLFQSPFGLHNSSARRSALHFANDVAIAAGGDVALECDEIYISGHGSVGRLISCCGGALFGVLGRGIIASTALCDVGIVERDIILSSARSCGFTVIERDLLRSELPTLDELFFCDHYGITALSRCEQRSYGNAVAGTIAEYLTQPW